MKKFLIALFSCVLVAGSAVATVAPKNGGKLPQAYYDRVAADRTAFTTQRAWVQKVQRIKQKREEFLRANGPQAASALPQEYVVTGTINVPVLLGEYANVAAPYADSVLQNQLFDNPSGTVTDYYDEVSYGNITLTGTAYPWVTLANNDTYYEGTNNGLGFDAHTGGMLKEILDANDPAVDFGIYDNDGPDGVPNSGDDDGYVDFVSFVHSETGGECGGNNNMWSHRWVYSGWPESSGVPYTTNDPAAGGGFIRVNDYTIQPSLSCASGVIEIGVFCHEFGHTFGLPDLYDTDGPGNGIGWWGIMGSGNWNQPSSPAHPCAWTRKELGWVIPTDVTPQGGAMVINQINTNPQAYRLGFTDERFRRSMTCAIAGAFSLYCGLTTAESTLRGWSSTGPNGGYGNGWSETIEREFTYSGSGTVNFSYQYDYDTEAGYDFAYAVVDVGGTESVLATYSGVGSSTANLNITPYLSSLVPGGGTYKLKFRATSDYSFADEDGDYDSNCGLMTVDNVSVTGGGESYTTGFETYIDGWHQPPGENPYAEYWLVENRQPVGSDSNLLQGGLLIMHIDDEVANSILGNTGTGSAVRGVVVEEADGNFNLISGTINRGDTGDPFPGSTNNTTFNSSTNPGSKDYQIRPTQGEVSSIGPSGAVMNAFMKAGDLAPSVASVAPNDIDNDQIAVSVVITGDRIKHGATFYFTNPSGAAAEGLDAAPADGADIVGTSIAWVDPVRLEGVINVYSKTGGNWDLVVTNPDGQSFTLNDAININFIVATQLASASIEVVNGCVNLLYELHGREEGETIRLYRSVVPDQGWVKIEDDLRPVAGERYVYIDSDVEPGRTFYYRLESVLPGGEARELHRGSATIPAREMSLSQNFPNPFNPTTSISFYLPEQIKLRLEIFDVSGKLVNLVASGVYSSGPHRVSWNGTDSKGDPVSSGVYVYRLTAGNRTMSKKMMLLK